MLNYNKWLKINSSKTEYQKNISSYEALIEQDEEHLTTMEEQDECPLCGEEISDAKIAEIKKKLKINRAKLTRARKGERDAAGLKESVRKEFLARADSITNMKETLMTILKLDGEIKP